jgi:hypothetical protein
MYIYITDSKAAKFLRANGSSAGEEVHCPVSNEEDFMVFTNVRH